MTLAYIALGSNLGEPEWQLRRGLLALDGLAGRPGLRHSSLYRSPPWDASDQPHYCNAVAELRWPGDALSLLDQLQAIERGAGRVRSLADRNAARTLDLDLLLFGHCRLQQEALMLPHPRMLQRAFVMIPLAELAPGLLMADGLSVAEHAARLADQPLSRHDWPSPAGDREAPTRPAD